MDKLSEKICEAALRHLSSRTWACLSLAGLAKSAKISGAQIALKVGSKDDLLPLISGYFDRKMTPKKGDFDAGNGVRDRLFDLLMRRFEALQPHQKAVITLARAVRQTPALAAPFFAAQLRSMEHILRLAEVSPTTPRKLLLLAAYHAAFLHFEEDFSAGLGPTMAALNRILAILKEDSRTV